MGRWQIIEVPWYETRIVNCSYCGRMIPKQIWVGGASGNEVFCSEKCEQLSDERAAGSAPALTADA